MLTNHSEPQRVYDRRDAHQEGHTDDGHIQSAAVAVLPINLEQFVTADHPMRKIRPLIDTDRIRQLCEPLYADVGRPSIPPEQLSLALVGRYLVGITSERALVRELTGDLVLRGAICQQTAR